jgi:hypothetical protein
LSTSATPVTTDAVRQHVNRDCWQLGLSDEMAQLFPHDLDTANRPAQR